jgi:malonyl CoA-acyl carrier protein transacylase
MGRELMQYQVYADSVKFADSYLTSIGAQWSVIDELNASEDLTRVNDSELSQPLCTVVQIALTDLIRHWGLQPSATVGHSSGEIAAAFAAGMITRQDALKIAFHRGRATKRIAEIKPEQQGGMLACALSEEKAQKYLSFINSNYVAVVACINSPDSVTISGDVEALQVLEKLLTSDGIFNRRLKVAHAYHSAHMDCAADEYKQAIADITPQKTAVNCLFYSSVLGTQLEGVSLDADYWCRNLTSPVKFLHAVNQMLPDPTRKGRNRQRNAATIDTMLEVGPSGALQGPLKQIISSKANAEDLSTLAMLSRGKNAIETSISSIGRLWTMGDSNVDLEKVNSPAADVAPRQVLADAPSYPWNHATRYWHDVPIVTNHRFPAHARLDLLGWPVEDWNPVEPRWRNRLRLAEQPWLKEHMVQGSILFPAAGFICAVLEAAQQVADPTKTVKQFELRDITVGRALSFEDDADVVELVISFKPRKLGLRSKEAPWIEWTAHSNDRKGHIEHCSGLLYTHYAHDTNNIEGGKEESARNDKLSRDYQDVLSASVKEMGSTELYAIFDSIGLQYGPLFQGIQRLNSGQPGAGCTHIKVTDTKSSMPMGFEYDHLLHPTTLDACFQSILGAFIGQPGQAIQTMVPTAINSIKIAAAQVKGAGHDYKGFVKGHRRGFRETVGCLYISDDAWEAPMIEVEGFTCTELGALTGGQVSETNATAAALRKVQSYPHWEPDAFTISQTTAEQIFAVSDKFLEVYGDAYAWNSIQLEKMSAIFCRRALQSLTPEAESKLPSHLALYLAWLREQHALAEAGAQPLQYGSKEWLEMTFDQEEAFIADMIPRHIDAKALAAIGYNLPSILDGSVDALATLMKEDMLFEFYSNSFFMEVTAIQWGKLFQLIGHKSPEMKILEIGAGTGSITEPILRALDNHDGSTTRCSSYVFTDISPGFFEKAEVKFAQWSNLMTFKRLDIEQDPIEQGFEAESFDIITATNVLHATKNMNVTLTNVAKLLKPDGKCIIGEITMPKSRLSMIYGTLPGWWLSDDGRQGGPCMSEDQWVDSFTRNGYNFDYGVRDVPDTNLYLMSFLCASKKSSSALPFDRVVIVDNGKPSSQLDVLADNLSKVLSTSGLSVERCSVTDVEGRVLPSDDRGSSTTGVVSLIEAETPFLLTLTAPELKAIQHLLLHTVGTLWVTRGDQLGECDPNFRMVRIRTCLHPE